MKLNVDCIRDVLLYLEENLSIKDGNKFSKITLKQLKNALTQYDDDDIFYAVYNLYQAKYIDGKITNTRDVKMVFCNITEITWAGHAFLDSIKPPTIWDATKKGAAKLGLVSIKALAEIATKLTNELISNPTTIAKIVEFLPK